LTGGIGAGKSTVAARLARLGAVVIDADRLAREVVEPGAEGLAEVVAAFGGGVLAPDGSLDRAALGRQVFADASARARLNGIMHPRIGALTAERMRAAGPEAIVVHDVPLLVEGRMGAAYHLVIVVHASAAERIRRLAADRGMAAEDAAARVAVQADDEARRAAADVWLDNSGDPQVLADAVDRVWTGRIVPYSENLRLRRPAGGAGPAGPAAVRRVRERLRWAAGDLALGIEDVEAAAGRHSAPGTGGSALELVLRVPDLASADAARTSLEEAGFLRIPTGTAAERIHAGADPAMPVVVRVRAGSPSPQGPPGC
jgi:dephospho-CoA kinase